MDVNDWKKGGRVGAEPEGRRVGDGYVVSFPLYWNDGKDFKISNKINVEAWNNPNRRAADEVKEMGIRKGDKLVASGYFKMRTKDDKTYISLVVSGADDIEIDESRSSKSDDGFSPF